MVFPAQVVRVLIASPSDVEEERLLAVRAIHEWNDRNSEERSVVLLPLRWETHSAPEYGKRPQEVINRQVVDGCDMLVGIFWTRVGSPTGIADSGTLEEIERVASAGKLVMLYFSQSKQDPDKIDLDQLRRLREFKAKTLPNALVVQYTDHVDFHDKLAKHLDIQIKTLLAERQGPSEGGVDTAPKTDILLHFADPASGDGIGTEYSVNTTYITVSQFESIPDYAPPSSSATRLASSPGLLLGPTASASPNRDYYRQLATSFVIGEFFAPLRFWLKNQGGIGARDVYIELRFDGETNSVLAAKDSLPSGSPSKSTVPFTFLSAPYPSDPSAVLAEGSTTWRTHFELPALQPQREISPMPTFVIGARENCTIKILARVFADTLPEPAVHHLTLNLNVTRKEIEGKRLADALVTRDSTPE